MPKTKNKFWNFKSLDESTGELTLYGEISSESWWGDEVTPKEFKKELDSLGDISNLNIYINSPGGDVFAGQAIHSMIKRHKAKVNVYIDGLAASIASVIAMAGDTIFMPKNAMMMIHKPWSWSFGNSNDFRKLADDLDKIEESIIEAYMAKATIDREEVQSLVDAETWLTAEEAKEKGFIDIIEETKAVAACVQSELFKGYKNTPKVFTDKPKETESNNTNNVIELSKAKLNLECEI